MVGKGRWVGFNFDLGIELEHFFMRNGYLQQF